MSSPVILVNVEPRAIISALVKMKHGTLAEALAGVILQFPSLNREQVKDALLPIHPPAVSDVMKALERSIASPSLASLELFTQKDVIAAAQGLGPDILAAVTTAVIGKESVTIEFMRAALLGSTVPPLTIFGLQDALEQSLLTRVSGLLREVRALIVSLDGCSCLCLVRVRIFVSVFGSIVSLFLSFVSNTCCFPYALSCSLTRLPRPFLLIRCFMSQRRSPPCRLHPRCRLMTRPGVVRAGR